MVKRGILIFATLALFFSATPLLHADVTQTDASATASAEDLGGGFYLGLQYTYAFGNGLSGSLNSLKLKFDGRPGNAWLLEMYCRLTNAHDGATCPGGDFGNADTLTPSTTGDGTAEYTATWGGTNTFEADKFYFFRLNLQQTTEVFSPATLSGSSNSASYDPGECYSGGGQTSDGLCTQVTDPYFELSITPLDLTAPNITITGPDEGLATSSTSVFFEFTADEAATFSCAFDGMGTSTPCSSPAATSTLAEGAHFFTVTATDTASNTSTSTRTFIVDTVAPTVTIDSGPDDASATSSTSVSFAFSANETTSFFCAWDGLATSTCSSPTASSSLLDGTHTFSIFGTDVAGNATTSITRTFSVDTVAPVLTLSGLADGALASSSPTFTFSSDDLGAVFTCKFDTADFSACTSPTSTPLADGAHSFTVVATDAVGNSASTTTTFWLDSTAPSLLEIAAIATSTDTTPDYSFSTTEAGALSYAGACSAAVTTAATGTNALTFAALAVGTYTDCQLIVTDIAGNATSLAVSPFEISAPPPPPPPPGGGGGGGVGNGPPIGNPSQGLPQGLILGVTTNAVEHASEKAKSIIEMIMPPAKVTPPSTPKQDTEGVQSKKNDKKVSVAPEPVVTPWDQPIQQQPSLAAAAATSGLDIPAWLWVALGLMALAILMGAYLMRPRA